MSTVTPIPGPDPQNIPPIHILGPTSANVEGDAETIARTIRILIPEGETIETRSLYPGKKGMRSDHWASPEHAANAVTNRTDAIAHYVLMNPFDAIAFAAAGAKGVTDAHITRRRWLLVDCDRVKLAGQADESATDQEKTESGRLALTIRETLRGEGWPEPILADSGNGWHLLYRIDLPNEAEEKELVRRVLSELAERFNTDQAEVDTKVFNASRITKLYGTFTRKGANTFDRPHRASSLAEVPETLEPVPRALLEALAPKPIETPTPIQPRTAPRSAPRGSKLTVEERAIRYLAKCDPAISGAKGHNQAFKTACSFGPGFDLPPEVAIRLFMAHYNDRCQPPWNPKEIAHKIAEAYKVESGRGWLLSREKPRAERDEPRAAAPATQRLSGKALHVEMGKLECTDLGNAGRLVGRHGADIRFCHSWGQWLIWDGKRWAVDQTGEIVRKLKATIRDILAEAHAAEDDQSRAKLAQWAVKSQDGRRINAALQLARSEPNVAITHEQLDLHPFLFNCQNGVLDLRTGILSPHRREDLLTQIAPVDFNPDAPCPLWHKTLETFFRREDPTQQAEIIGYLQRLFGYSMAAVTDEHVLPVCYGEGSNGKSTILELILDAFGEDYGCKSPETLLMAKKFDGHPTEMAALFRKRLVVAVETDQGRRLNESRVKALTGGDSISARRMREDYWQFKPSHTLFLATNHLPEVRGTDHGIWRRLKEVPFVVTVAGDQADPQMPRKIRGLEPGFHSELPGILAWAVQGFLDWQSGGLREPAEVTQATARYKQGQDPIAGFLEECVIRLEGPRVKASILYDAYKTWATRRNEKVILSQKIFGQSLEAKGFQTKASNGIQYLNVALRDDRPEPE